MSFLFIDAHKFELRQLLYVKSVCRYHITFHKKIKLVCSLLKHFWQIIKTPVLTSSHIHKSHRTNSWVCSYRCTDQSKLNVVNPCFWYRQSIKNMTAVMFLSLKTQYKMPYRTLTTNIQKIDKKKVLKTLKYETAAAHINTWVQWEIVSLHPLTCMLQLCVYVFVRLGT